jgi:PIN domain nuclease of toxin-antitoxin system
VWALAEPHRLDRETRATIESGDTEVLFSAASIWEIAAKAGHGRNEHRDPFDRVLVAQAAVEPATLYTADQQLVRYSDLVRRIGAQ